jgi:hypothetical protein
MRHLFVVLLLGVAPIARAAPSPQSAGAQPAVFAEEVTRQLSDAGEEAALLSARAAQLGRSRRAQALRQTRATIASLAERAAAEQEALGIALEVGDEEAARRAYRNLAVIASKGRQTLRAARLGDDPPEGAEDWILPRNVQGQDLWFQSGGE